MIAHMSYQTSNAAYLRSYVKLILDINKVYMTLDYACNSDRVPGLSRISISLFENALVC